MTTRVELEFKGHVARVRFLSENGIQLLGASVRKQLAEIVTKLEKLVDCRVVVFEAEGRTFLAGADIRELQSLNGKRAVDLARETHELFGRIAALPAVTVAAIHAACAGGGFELALCCDLRYASTSARMGLPEVSLGLIPGWGGTVRMWQLFGPAVSRYVILRGELLSAEEALRLGLVHGIAPEETFRDYVGREVELLLQRSPAALRTVKALLDSFGGPELRHNLAREARMFGRCYRSPDSLEGMAAFLEKRPPQWTSPQMRCTEPEA